MTTDLRGSVNVEAATTEEAGAMEEAMTVRMRHGTRTGSDVLLYKNLKDLYIVWKEWEFGLNRVKLVRDFTPRERGANKFT